MDGAGGQVPEAQPVDQAAHAFQSVFHAEMVLDPVAQVDEPPTTDPLPFKVGPRFQDRNKLLLLFRSQAAGRTAARLIAQTIRTRFVEAANPIVNGLPVNALGARNLHTAGTAKDHRKGAKTAGKTRHPCIRGSKRSSASGVWSVRLISIGGGIALAPSMMVCC